MPNTQILVDALRTLHIPPDALTDLKATKEAIKIATKDAKNLRRDALDALEKLGKKDLDSLRSELAAAGTASSVSSARTVSDLAPTGAGTVSRQDIEQKLPVENTPEVTALLAIYKHKHKGAVPRAAERILKWTKLVHDAVVAKDTREETIDHLLAVDIRRQLFLLEGLLKLYKTPFDGVLAKSYERVRELEDVLGDYSFARKMAKSAEEKGLPKAAVEYLQEQAKKTRKQVKNVLKDSWSKDDRGQVEALDKVVRHVMKADWDGPEEDRAFLKERIASEFEEIEKTKFDMNQLEDGLHEFRRQLRWIPIYCEAVDGLVVLDPTATPIAAYAAALQSEMAQSKYVKLPLADREKRPIVVPLSLYTQNMLMIFEFGGMKDEGEHLHALVDALRHAGLAETDAMKQALTALGKTLDSFNIHARAQVLYDDLAKNGLIRAIRRTIEQG